MLAVGEGEDVAPLGEDGAAVGGDVVDEELDLLDAAAEALDGGADLVGTDDRCQRDVVVHGVVGEEGDDLVEVLRPHASQKRRTTSMGCSSVMRSNLREGADDHGHGGRGRQAEDDRADGGAVGVAGQPAGGEEPEHRTRDQHQALGELVDPEAADDDQVGIATRLPTRK